MADWLGHFAEYYPGVMAYDLTHKLDLAEFMERAGQRRVGVINYELAFRRPELLKLRDFTLMLDESSLISNEQAKRSRFVLKLRPSAVILLSGTPTSGKYERLWSQLRLLGWGISKGAFMSSYVVTEWADFGGFMRQSVVGYKNVEHLKKRLAEYGAVFMKAGEAVSLPGQVEQRVMLEPTREYKRFMRGRYVRLKDGTELVGDSALTTALRARQLCGVYHEEKLGALRDIMESTGERLVVFYNFNAELEEMKRMVSGCGRPVSVVCGHMKDLSAYESEEGSVTFVQYQAGAMGLNLQKACRAVYFTLPLGKGSCDLWEQSKKRIHRIGQERTCFYYYLLVRDSIEERNLAALQEGKELTDELFVPV